MGVKRVIDVDFWKDDMVAERFSAEDRYFFLYLLTNPNSKQCGIYHLPLRVIAFEMGHSKESVESIIERFEHRFKNIIYNKETQEIAILNFLKHSIIKGGKPVEDCIRKELEKVKDRSLILAVYKHMLNYMNENIEKNEKSMYKGIKNILLSFIDENELNDEKENVNDNDNERIVPRIVDDKKSRTISYDSNTTVVSLDKELEKDNKENIIKEIIDHLNLKANTKYRPTTDKTKKCINARLNEGFTLDDFKSVIDIKTKQWLGTEWEQYLRPETLFGTKFESYLNTKIESIHNKQPQQEQSNKHYFEKDGIKYLEEDGILYYYDCGLYKKVITDEDIKREEESKRQAEEEAERLYQETGYRF